MNKQTERLLSEGKLLAWIEMELAKEYPESVSQYVDGRETVLEILKHRIEQRIFDHDPIPLPTLKPGDKVRHKERRMKYLGVGNVKEIASSGIRALVEWPSYDKEKCLYPPIAAYYLLDKLELVEDKENE